jgi:cobalt-zinc-cadmium efflux system outer membrane protein
MKRRLAVTSLALALGLGLGFKSAFAQAPSLPAETGMLGGPAPGSTTSLLGPPPGAGAVPFDTSPGAGQNVLGGRPGAETPRVPSTITTPGADMQPRQRPGIAPPARVPIQELPLYGPLDAPVQPVDEGPANGLTLDQAIERLVHENLALRSQYYEIPQAEADILTAGLRANPLFYADAQLVPYGQYSNTRPGGPLQYDINITHPFDLTGKRRARRLSATRAKNVLELQYQNAVRLQIQNLYTVWVDLLSARQLLAFRRKSLEGYQQLYDVTLRFYQRGTTVISDVRRVGTQVASTKALLLLDEEALKRAKRTLGTLLNLSPEEAEALEVRGTIADLAPLPPSTDVLVQMALDARPDVSAYRLGVSRAEADVVLAKASRMQDVYVLFQPYTFQNAAPFGLKSSTSWALGATVPLPFYNRNQGNIQRAVLNVEQSNIELDMQARQVITEVLQAERDYASSREAALLYEKQIIPEAREMREAVRKLFEGGESDVITYLNTNREYIDLVRQFRDVVVQHRRSMLMLNTAVGKRILP